MITRLLDRQANLLKYLTSSEAIFGVEGAPPLDQMLQRFDRGLLRLEACFSHEKRMEKIIAVFPRTFRILGVDQTSMLRGFVEAYPPIDISRLENARQFHDFLCARWQREPVEPPYLRDVMACEFACAKVRVGAEAVDAASAGYIPRDGIRRHPDAILRECAYDIRPVFEGASIEAAPIKRDTRLAIAMPPGAEHPDVFELAGPAFDLLAMLDNWTDRSALRSMPELDECIRELAEHGLVEVHG